MAGALSAPGPGRLAAADAVVRADPTVTIGHGDDAEKVDVVPGPRLPAAAVERAAGDPGVARAIGDVAFARGCLRRPRRRAARRRRRSRAGPRLAERRADAVPPDGRAGAGRPARRRRRRTPRRSRRDVAADRDARRRGELPRHRPRRRPGEPRRRPGRAVLRRRRPRRRCRARPGASTRSASSPQPGVAAARCARGCSAHGPEVEVLDRDHGADADAGDPTGRRPHGAGRDLRRDGRDRRRRRAVRRRRHVRARDRPAPARDRRAACPRRDAAPGAAPDRGRGADRCRWRRARSACWPAGRSRRAIVGVLADHGVAPRGFEPGHSWVPLVAALGRGIGIAQLAVVAAARRAGRVRPSRGAARGGDRARPSRLHADAHGVLAASAGGSRWRSSSRARRRSAFSILGGILLATGTALLGRVAARPAGGRCCRGRCGCWVRPGCSRARAWRPTAGARAALATPIVLIAMLVGTQGVLQASSQQTRERVTAARVTADHVVVGHDGAPLPAGTAARLARLPGVDAAAGVLPTRSSCSTRASAGTRRGRRPGSRCADAARAARPPRHERHAARRARLGRRGQQRRRDARAT